MFSKKAITRVPIHELLASRWSGKAYDPDRPLAREQIEALMEAAQWAPSCYGEQPWRYIVCDRSINPDAWRNALACLSEGNQSWSVNAPLLFLACADSVFEKKDGSNRWGQHDTGAASENLCLQATAMGLMAHQMGGFDVEAARTAFAIPGRYMPMAIIAIGYQLPLERMADAMRMRELNERNRKLLEENFFNGQWSQPWK